MNRIEKVKRECFEHTKKELPDCVMSYIFSKLSMKDLVKTSILSKTWIHEWRSTKDLNFDIHNMFGCSNRYYPDDLTLNNCKFDSDLNITCPTLCHLNIVDHKRHLRWAPPPRNEEIPHAFDIIASLHQLQNLSINLTHSQITILPKSLGPFQYLRKLELFISDEMPNHDFFRILDIVMASPRLQELFVTIKDLHLVSDHEHMKEPERFSHNELKYVEFRGCECKAFQNLLDKHLWGNMKSSPKKIAFKSCGKFYVGAGIWIKGYSKDHWLGSGVNYMCDILRDSLINKLYLSFCSIN
ncbi:uncharacterized protein [Medicago truncatula]|uniref:uncharacterized protein isoform X2 n=1 Tax=Medicago truncatula TaxID=3880 RepID=UPI0019689219|nr:uncharacterized protein LOC120578226 isoform X2 [Medicago truncatula]